MAHDNSSVAGFFVDSSTGVLTDISAHVNNVTINGGNGLIQDTGLGFDRHTETLDIQPVATIAVTYMCNSTTDAIFSPVLASGTTVAKTVQVLLRSGSYISGESNIGPVSQSIPIGLQTGTTEFHSTSSTGFDHTSVAL